MGAACTAGIRVKSWMVGRMMRRGLNLLTVVIYGLAFLGTLSLPLVMLNLGFDPVGLLLGASVIPGASLWMACGGS